MMTYDPKVCFTCKQCKKCFVRDFKLFSEKDKKCSHCDVLWCCAAITPESKLKEECLDTIATFYDKSIDPSQSFFSL